MMGHAQELRRRQAITRYLAGDKIETICSEMQCAKSWLYKWKARYQADNPAWTAGLSTQPKHTPRQTPLPIVQRILTMHRTLVQGGTSGSARAIQQALTQQGVEPMPSLRTIARIVQRQTKKNG